MQPFEISAVLSAITLLLSAYYVAAEPVAEPAPQSTGLHLNALVDEGCYSSADGLADQGSYTFQSSGHCQELCAGGGYSVMALWKGSNCLCGNALPPDSAKTDNSSCNTPCDGYDIDTCRLPLWEPAH
jgi:cell wall integrity and stress response component